MKHSALSCLSCIVSTLALASPAAAQLVGGRWETVHRFEGGLSGLPMGWSVAGAGDVDGDGFDDLIVGAPNTTVNGLAYAGSAFVYSGATGGMLHRFDGAVGFASVGWSVAGAGDVDRDGFTDVILGVPGADSAQNPGAGAAVVHSGATGALLWRFDGVAAYDLLGRSVAGAGDVDGDGAADLLAGAGVASPGGRYFAGSAYVYSGATGALLHRFDGAGTWDEYGRSVAGAGDVDRDGHADVIVGAWYAETTGGQRAGCAYVHALDPFLRPSAREISASSGVPVTFALDFPASEAGQAYLLLASRAGTGPTTLGGVEVPLTADALLARLLAGWTPPLVTGAYGVLDPNGDGTATLASGPALAAYVGQSVYLAALSFAPPAGARLSSIARVLTVVP